MLKIGDAYEKLSLILEKLQDDSEKHTIVIESDCGSVYVLEFSIDLQKRKLELVKV